MKCIQDYQEIPAKFCTVCIVCILIIFFAPLAASPPPPPANTRQDKILGVFTLERCVHRIFPVYDEKEEKGEKTGIRSAIKIEDGNKMKILADNNDKKQLKRLLDNALLGAGQVWISLQAHFRSGCF